MQTPASNLPAIEISGLSKTYPSGESELTVLTEIHFSLSAGESLAIVGPSGSGKTTLLGLCAGLDLPTTGSIRLLGEALEDLDEDARARLRGKQIGFVFQNFQLIPTLTALENVSVPIDLLGGRDGEAKAKRLLAKVGLAARMDHYPIQLSGGEQQRVALARAFINEPKILFADEPTGNLDGNNGGTIEELLFNLNHELGTTLVLVTHDSRLAAKCDRILSLRDGRIVESTQSATV
jgi:putative ABC transport system ATP-binding protein|tara:strand:- start:7016 stop:7723 length:708 start_codon:yes stop_codon:yes gene_type:complete